MKKNIHPIWNHQATFTCACGNSFIAGSMGETLQLDICNKCHPFFTGEERFVDTQGRVEKFMKKMEAAKAKQAAQAAKMKAVVAPEVEKTAEEAKTYQQLLAEQKISLKKEEKAA